MAHGVEGRVPFLDHRIVEFAFKLPPEYKVRDGLRKRVLLDAARAFLPDLVLNRTDKKTFVSKLHWMPLRERYAGPLREMAASRTIRETPGFHAPAVRRFVEDYLSGRNDDILAVWRLFTACRWLELHGLA
jgi:asparagine synthase (glutamine-hydrolysing)